jgi:hypothetical protein
MPDPKPIEDQAESIAAEQRRRAQERRTAAGFTCFLVLVILGSLWLAGILEWVVRGFRMVAGS